MTNHSLQRNKNNDLCTKQWDKILAEEVSYKQDHNRMRLALLTEVIYIGNLALIHSAATRAALPDPDMLVGHSFNVGNSILPAFFGRSA